MLHHYITKYSFEKTDGTIENRVESWIQINVFNRAICLAKKHIVLDNPWNA